MSKGWTVVASYNNSCCIVWIIRISCCSRVITFFCSSSLVNKMPFERKMTEQEYSGPAFSSLQFWSLVFGSFDFIGRPTLEMSDTSTLGDYNDEGQNFGKTNCWNQFGANVCVGILTLLVIDLSVPLIYPTHITDRWTRINHWTGHPSQISEQTITVCDE